MGTCCSTNTEPVETTREVVMEESIHMQADNVFAVADRIFQSGISPKRESVPGSRYKRWTLGEIAIGEIIDGCTLGRGTRIKFVLPAPRMDMTLAACVASDEPIVIYPEKVHMFGYTEHDDAFIASLPKDDDDFTILPASSKAMFNRLLGNWGGLYCVLVGSVDDGEGNPVVVIYNRDGTNVNCTMIDTNFGKISGEYFA